MFAGSHPSSPTDNSSEPQIDPSTGAVKRRALKDAPDAFVLYNTLKEENKERSVKNGRIMAKYNAEAPYKSSDLKAEGLDWKSNFSTKPLAVLIDKIGPRFVRAINGARFLTSASLPESVQGGAAKTERFRRKITDTIRGWKGWKPFLAELCQENALFGYALAGWTDEYGWRPTFYRQDEFFVPKGAKQSPEALPVLCLREPYLIHEAYEIIADPKAAEAAGWDLEKMADAINEALPDDHGQGSSDSDSRRHADSVREASVSTSYSKGAQVVVFAHVLVTEPDGQVSHYILNERNGDQLFLRHDRFKSMAECCALFSFQQANGTLHGSKGIGREVYNIAAAVDRARNEVMDRLQLAGKLIIRSDDKLIRKFSMSVVGGAIVIDKAYEIGTQVIDANVDAFQTLDQYLVRQLDEIAGGTTPREFAGERVTKAAVDLFASREEEKRDLLIERFLGQIGDLITEITVRLCNPESDDSEARILQSELGQVMSPEEIAYLASRPAIQTVDDFTQSKTQELIIFAESKKGNPLYNQRQLEYRAVAARFGEEFADDVLLAEEDPTVTAEQTRGQMLENLALLQGLPVPVSPRDNARLHLDMIAQALSPLAQGLASEPEKVIPLIGAFVQHAQDHINAAVSAGAKQSEFADDIKGLTGLAKQVGEIQAQLDAAEQLKQQMPADGSIDPAAQVQQQPVQPQV
jgi:hypothetical protein